MTDAIINAAESGQGADPARATPGEYLRKLREDKGHTHAVVGTALHLTVHYIKALESDDYGKLPGLTFVKGYLRAYARFLGADVDKVLVLFDEHIAGLLDAGKHTARVERSKRRQDQALRWGIGAGFVVVAGLVAGWWFMSGQTEPAESAARNTLAQEIAAVTAPPPARTAVVAPRASTAPATTVTAPPAAIVSTAVAPDQTVAADAPQAVVDIPGDAHAATPGDIEVAPAANGARQVSLVGAGDDELRVTFNGASWIEVDDGRLVRIFQDMLAAGDTLTIRGEAPFHVLLGDAANVDVALNATAVDISADIRDDASARLVLGGPAAAASAAQDTSEAPL